MTREDGFYWVKHPEDGWMVMEWNGDKYGMNSWSECGDGVRSHKDSDLEEIDERRIIRLES